MTDALNADQARALDLLGRAQSFVLVGHERPDGDVLGSQGGLWSVLRRLGKEVRIVNPDPPATQFGFLADQVPFESYGGGPLPAHDVTVMLDFADLSRTGRQADAIAACDSQKLVIDHHLPPAEVWWDEAFVDRGAAATGLLVLRIARSLGVEVDAIGATSIFTAIATDTGWFRFSNCDAETMEAAAALTAAGAAPHQIHQSLFKRRADRHLRDLGELLAQTQLFADGRIAYVEIDADADPDLEAGDAALELVREVGTVQMALMLRDVGDGHVRLSARSEGAVEVHGLADRFGGGGHRKASGASFEASLDVARERVLAAAFDVLGVDGGTSSKGRGTTEGRR